MVQLRENIFSNCSASWLNNYDTIPSTLFSGIVQRNTIIIAKKQTRGQPPSLWTTNLQKWYVDARPYLFELIPFVQVPVGKSDELVPKVSTKLEMSILAKLRAQKTPITFYTVSSSTNRVYYKRRWSYFLLFADHVERIIMPDGSTREQIDVKALEFEQALDKYVAVALLSSGVFYFRYSVFADFRHVNISDFEGFNFDRKKLTESWADLLSQLGKKLMKSYKDNIEWRECNYKGSIGECSVPFYRQGNSKPIIDEIDRVLARHYGFTDEELDFIINYDIKYRMGDQLREEGEEE
jgi:hypothetical protein